MPNDPTSTSFATWTALHAAGYFAKHKSYATDPDNDHGLASIINYAGLLFHQPNPGLAVLDYGCGYGRLAVPIIKALQPASMLLVDFPEAIAQARTYITGRTGDYRPFLCSYSPQEFYDTAAPASIDFAYSVTVFQHLPTELKVKSLRAILQRLRDGATAIVQFGDSAKPGAYRTHKWGGGPNDPEEPKYATTRDEVERIVQHATYALGVQRYDIHTVPSDPRPEVNWHWLVVKR